MLITLMKLARFSSGALAGTIRTLQTACTAIWRWQQQRKAAADLHALSDYSLKDIGLARSRIDEQVRLSARRYVQPHNSTGLI
jgi:uncharacterized protein YjiS (DUF1127 family)